MPESNGRSAPRLVKFEIKETADRVGYEFQVRNSTKLRIYGTKAVCRRLPRWQPCPIEFAFPPKGQHKFVSLLSTCSPVVRTVDMGKSHCADRRFAVLELHAASDGAET